MASVIAETEVNPAAISETRRHPWVTIQFGHNDQKPAKNISLAQYQENLIALAEEVKTVGGTPVCFYMFLSLFMSEGRKSAKLARKIC